MIYAFKMAKYNLRQLLLLNICVKRADIYKAVDYTSNKRGEACIQAIEVRINVLENVENSGSVMINVNLLTTDRLSFSLRRGKIVIKL